MDTPGGVESRGRNVARMSTQTINHAIVGCGRIAPSHADAFRELSDASLAVFCDIEEAKAEALAERFGGGQRLSRYQDVLEDKAIDSVSLCVPHYLHDEYSEMALLAGKHVLVEKPFAIKTERATELKNLAAEKGLVLQPVCQHRFDKVVQHVREIVEQELGEISMVRAHLECHRKKEYYGESEWRGRWETEGGSVLINQAYHVVDLLLWIAGPIKRLSAQMDTLTGGDVMETEDVFTAQLRFQNRALGSLTVNGASGAEWHSYIELCGTGGVVGFDIGYPNQVPRLRLKSRRAMKRWRDTFKELAAANPLPTVGLGYYGDSHRREAEAFVSSIRGLSSEFASTPDQATEVVRTVSALYEAARQGSWIEC